MDEEKIPSCSNSALVLNHSDQKLILLGLLLIHNEKMPHGFWTKPGNFGHSVGKEALQGTGKTKNHFWLLLK